MSHLRDPKERERATFRTSRVLPYPRDQVFEAFARPELLARWWGPNGFTNTFEVFEFEPGGVWKFVMHGPDGSHYPNESVFLQIEAPEKLVIQHASKPHFVLTITLHEDDDSTRIDWVGIFDDADVADRLRPMAETANEQNLDRLAALLAATRR